MEVEVYYKNNQLGIDIWKKKYQNDEESFDNWLNRVSGNNQNIKDLIIAKKFLFGGRILANRGITGRNVSLSNCYTNVIEEDSIEGIYKTAEQLAVTFAHGGGVGTDLSALSPRGAIINNAAKTTSGAVSFIPIFDTTCELIGASGRRAALLIALNSEHPDLEEFIDAKIIDGAITKANLSVIFSDEFMEHVINDEVHTLSFTRHNGTTITKEINARNVFKKFCENNCDWSEPGALFWGAIQNWNLQSENDLFKIVLTNACSEITLAQHAACLLASINVGELVYDGKLNYNELADITRQAIRELDKVLDEGMQQHPLQEQCDAAARYRQLGLGIMGLADAFIKMECVYGSEESCRIASKITHVMLNAAVQESTAIAYEDGMFDACDIEAVMRSEFFIENLDADTKALVAKYGLRHASLLGIAPTGTIASMLNLGGTGGEPLYALKYTRKTQSLHGEDVYYDVYPNIVSEYMEAHSLKSVDELPEWFITAKQINPHNRILVQSALQTCIDNSISSTINLPHSAIPEDVYNIYLDAWNHGLKGITVHREGNKREGVLTEGTAPKSAEDLARGDWALIPSDTLHYKHKIHTGCGELHLFIGFSRTSNKIEELWIKRSNGGGCERSLDSILITMSAILRLGGNVNNIEKALRGVGTCTSFAVARAKGKKLSRGGNCAIAMLNTIKAFNVDTYIGESKAEFIQTTLPVISRPQCAECGADLVFEGGCAICKNCGYSKCS